jgi:hypothetical protein
MLPSTHSCKRPDGSLDIIKYVQVSRARRRRRRKRRRRAVSSSNLVDDFVDDDDDDNATPIPKVRFRTYKFSRMDSSGQITTITPLMSTWYFLYVGNKLLDDDITLQRQFRNRFRMTYQSFMDLVEMCKASDIFSVWCQRKEKNNKQSSSVELLLLGSLRYLGRGWTFDDIDEGTKVSRNVHRGFFHAFMSSQNAFGHYFYNPSRFFHALMRSQNASGTYF